MWIARLITSWRTQQRCTTTAHTSPFVVQTEVVLSSSGLAILHIPHGAFYNPAVPFPPQPFAWPFMAPPQGWQDIVWEPTLAETTSTMITVREDTYGNKSDHLAESDVANLLSEKETNQFREPPAFDPNESSWQPPESRQTCLELNFDRNLMEEKQKSILSDYPILSSSVLRVPTLILR